MANRESTEPAVYLCFVLEDGSYKGDGLETIMNKMDHPFEIHKIMYLDRIKDDAAGYNYDRVLCVFRVSKDDYLKFRTKLPGNLDQ